MPAAWAAPQAAGAAPITQEWIDGFGSAELSDLVHAARAHSLDLQSAAARVRQADARARAAGAVILPKVDPQRQCGVICWSLFVRQRP